MGKDNYFNVRVIFDGEEYRAQGYITQYFPATGPTMDHAGGEPAEGGELEDVRLYQSVDGVEMEVEDEEGEILNAVEDQIREKVDDDKY